VPLYPTYISTKAQNGLKKSHFSRKIDWDIGNEEDILIRQTRGKSKDIVPMTNDKIFFVLFSIFN
jgi:hypothetical protein